MKEDIYIPALTTSQPNEIYERVALKIRILADIFSAFNRNGNSVMLAENFDNVSDTETHFITFRYMGSKRIRAQIEKPTGTSLYSICFGVLAESAPDDSLTTSHILTKKTTSTPAGTGSGTTSDSGIITINSNSTGFSVTAQLYYSDGTVFFDAGTMLSGYTAKHMTTGDRVMLINDRLPGSDVVVSSSTTQGIAIPRPSTLLAPQSDIMYGIPIINPSGDDAGFTGYFTDGKFVFSNIHQYPVGTTIKIEGKLFSVTDTNYVVPLED